MKQLLSLALVAFLQLNAQAQNDCYSGRYHYPPLFDSVVVSSAVQFGSNAAVLGGGQQALYMDVYEPYGDTLANRPVVLAAFGGSFIAGSRADVADFCMRMARLGYVAIAPDYRVGFFFPNSNTTQLAVTRCMHDLRGCIRCLRKTTVLDGNPWRIDPERIIVGGVSAGGIGAVQVAYLDQSSEIPPILYDDTLSIGAVEGNSGWPGYSSRPLAAWSMSGAIGDTSWIQPGDVPLFSLHEVGDIIVPYGTQEVSLLGIPTGVIASGSSDIHLRMDHIGVPNCFFSYPGNGHVGYLVDDPENAIGRVAAFLADVVCGQPITCGNLSTDLAEQQDANIGLTLFPNPTTDMITMQLNEPAVVSLADQLGRVVLQQKFASGNATIDLSAWPQGIYTLKCASAHVLMGRVVKQ
jgi:acetyl esterase/lipase